MDKTSKNLLLQNQLTDDLETWYVALCIREYYQDILNYDSELTLTYFPQGQIWSLTLCKGKGENYIFLETFAAIDLKVDLNIQINELMKLKEYQMSIPCLDKDHSDFKT